MENMNEQAPQASLEPTQAPTPATPEPGIPKKKIGLIAGVLVAILALAGGLTYLLGGSSTEIADDEPPSLVADQSTVQGFIKGDKFGFLKYEEADKEAFAALKQSSQAETFSLPQTNPGGMNLLYATEDLTFEKIIKRVGPQTERVFVAMWDPTKKIFYSSPHTYYKEKTDDGTILIDQGKENDAWKNFEVPAGRAFFLIAQKDTEVVGLYNGAASPENFTNVCKGKKGWVLTYIGPNLYDSVSPCLNSIKSIYTQKDDKPTEFTKVYGAIEDVNSLKSTAPANKIAWIRYNEDPKTDEETVSKASAPILLEKSVVGQTVNISFKQPAKLPTGHIVKNYFVEFEKIDGTDDNHFTVASVGEEVVGDKTFSVNEYSAAQNLFSVSGLDSDSEYVFKINALTGIDKNAASKVKGDILTVDKIITEAPAKMSAPQNGFVNVSGQDAFVIFYPPATIPEGDKVDGYKLSLVQVAPEATDPDEFEFTLLQNGEEIKTPQGKTFQVNLDNEANGVSVKISGLKKGSTYTLSVQAYMQEATSEKTGETLTIEGIVIPNDPIKVTIDVANFPEAGNVAQGAKKVVYTIFNIESTEEFVADQLIIHRNGEGSLDDLDTIYVYNDEASNTPVSTTSTKIAETNSFKVVLGANGLVIRQGTSQLKIAADISDTAVVENADQLGFNHSFDNPFIITTSNIVVNDGPGALYGYLMTIIAESDPGVPEGPPDEDETALDQTAPSNLVATAIGDAVQFTWDPPTDGKEIVEYNLIINGPEDSPIILSNVNSPHTISNATTGVTLVENTTYSVRVEAVFNDDTYASSQPPISFVYSPVEI